MIFHVRMNVAVTHDLDIEQRNDLLFREKERAQELQRSGTWVHLWRVVGHYSNISIFDVESPDELHEILWSLPLFPFMEVEVTALTAHPSAIDQPPTRP
jgi:muconolactone D-isomerase